MKNSSLICDFAAPRGNARGREGSSPRLTLPMGPLGLALCALFLYGCSASASRGDTQGGPQVANLAPEQCLENAAIQSAGDQQNYHIQRGDRLAINFYLNPE